MRLGLEAADVIDEVSSAVHGDQFAAGDEVIVFPAPGSRGFLDAAAPATAAGMLTVPRPGGLLPFAAGSGRQRTASEWRAIRLRLKQAVLAVSLQGALTALGASGRLRSEMQGPLLDISW